MPPSIASVVHTFEAVAGSWRSVSLQQSAQSWVEPHSEIKIAKNIGKMTFGEGFCKCCQPEINVYDINKCK